LIDLQTYADRLAELDGGVDDMTDAEVVHVLAVAMRRIATSIGYLLRGVA
jgi:hypothetical protein